MGRSKLSLDELDDVGKPDRPEGYDLWADLSSLKADISDSNHTTPHMQIFDTNKPSSGRKMFMDDNGMVEAVGKGSVLVKTRVDGRARSIQIYDVLHIPNLHSNLLSVSKLITRALKVQFNLLGCVVKMNNREMLAMALLESNLCLLDLNMMNETKMSSLAHFEANSYP